MPRTGKDRGESSGQQVHCKNYPIVLTLMWSILYGNKFLKDKFLWIGHAETFCENKFCEPKDSHTNSLLDCFL